MKRYIIIIVWLLCCFGRVAYGQTLKETLDSLLQHPMFETTVVGIEVYDLTADSCLYKYNERQRMRPASTMKMITAVAALEELGGDYQFKTRMYRTGYVEGRTLVGNIYCRGGMDPLFNSDDLSAFVETLNTQGTIS